MADGFAAEMLEILSLSKQPMHERQECVLPIAFRWRRSVVQNFFGDDAPSSPRTCVSRNVRAAVGARLSSRESASRRLPSAARAITGERAGFRPSGSLFAQIY